MNTENEFLQKVLKMGKPKKVNGVFCGTSSMSSNKKLEALQTLISCGVLKPKSTHKSIDELEREILNALEWKDISWCTY